MPFVDRLLTCADCGQEFIFSAEQQEFFHLKGYTNVPKRCGSCRARRQRGSRPTHRPVVETTTTCAECGTQTTVPFKPSGHKPVLCATCFQAKRGPGASGPQLVR